jgi:hypothetical protein
MLETLCDDPLDLREAVVSMCPLEIHGESHGASCDQNEPDAGTTVGISEEKYI